MNRAAKRQNHAAKAVRALATPLARERAMEQGYEPARASTTVLAGRTVAGIAEPVDLIVIE